MLIVFLSVPEDGSKADLYSKDEGSGRQRWVLTPLQGHANTYTIRSGGGVNNNRQLLSCTDDGSKVDLYTHDDNSGRQRWVFQAKALIRENHPHNTNVASGVSNGRVFFSCTDDGSKVDLYTQDDASGRQQWVFRHLGNNVYNINVANGIKNNRVLLSCSDDGSRVDLHSVDDASGRQRWIVSPVPNRSGEYHIRVAGGINNNRLWLSCTDDGSKVDLYTHDDNSGRQRWVIRSK